MVKWLKKSDKYNKKLLLFFFTNNSIDTPLFLWFSSPKRPILLRIDRQCANVNHDFLLRTYHVSIELLRIFERRENFEISIKPNHSINSYGYLSKPCLNRSTQASFNRHSFILVLYNFIFVHPFRGSFGTSKCRLTLC